MKTIALPKNESIANPIKSDLFYKTLESPGRKKKESQENKFVSFPTAECNESRFPDPRDFRIAIVEGIPETRLHISFLSPTAQSLAAGKVNFSFKNEKNPKKKRKRSKNYLTIFQKKK